MTGWPSLSEFENVAKTLLAVGAVIGGIWTLSLRLLKRRRMQREMRLLESKSIRYLIDAMHHVLDVFTPSSEERMTNVTELHRQTVLIRAIRRELWTADGHDLPEDSLEAQIKKVITRTQAIKRLKDERGNVIGWQESELNDGERND